MKPSDKAFPYGPSDHEASGMTLRDYFAAKALQGLLSNTDTILDDDAKTVKWAYELADAMIKERGQ